jgi:F0F1-type ATP synthase membrane subunit b/b'
MALVRCKRCGWETSALASACHKCQARLPRESDDLHLHLPRFVVLLPFLLLITAAAIAAPPVVTTLGDYRARIAAERTERERQEEARHVAALAEQQRVMTRRVDSLIRALPAGRMRRVSEMQLREAATVVTRWGTDSAAKRWERAAQKELVRRQRSASGQPTRSRQQPSAAQPVAPLRTQRPERPAGATARCRDGTYSYSASRRGTCSHHGGVAVWY